MSLRVWRQEHPVRTTITIIVAILVVCGGYVYFNIKPAPVQTAAVPQVAAPVTPTPTGPSRNEFDRLAKAVDQISKDEKALGQEVEDLKKTVTEKMATATPSVVAQSAQAPPAAKPAPPQKPKALPPRRIVRRHPRRAAPPVQLAQRRPTQPLAIMPSGWTSGKVLFDQVRCQQGRAPENPNNCQ